MKVKMMIHPTATFSISPKGKIEGPMFSHSSSKVEDYYSSEYAYIQLFAAPPIEVEVEVPNNFDAQLLAALRAGKEKLRAEHTAAMTKLQFLENNLLKLEAPEVLDAAERRPSRQETGETVREHLAGDGDDILF